MKALSVHGDGATLDRTSCNVGRWGQYAPPGMERLNGLDGKNSPEDDMSPSSSASQSEKTEEGDDSLKDDDV